MKIPRRVAIVAVGAVSIAAMLLLFIQKDAPAPQKNGGRDVVIYTDKKEYTFMDSVQVTVENRGNSTLIIGGPCGEVGLEFLDSGRWVEYAGMRDAIFYQDKFCKPMNVTCGDPLEGEAVVQAALQPGEMAQYQVETMEGPMFVVPTGKFRAKVYAYSGCNDFYVRDGLAYGRCAENRTLLSGEFTVAQPAYPT
jgi:hypothetical protein